MNSEKSKRQTDQPPAPSAVDTHFHVFEAGQSLPGARYTPAYAASWQAWQAVALPVGVTHGVLVQTSFMGTDNRQLLAHLAAHPDTLRGVAVVAPETNSAELGALHTQGVRGIRLNLAGQGLHPMADWGAATALWDALLSLGWHVELHTDTGALPGVLAALPAALPVVVDHFGKPQKVSSQDATIVALRQGVRRGQPSAHIKLSGAYRLQAGVSPQALAQLWLDELGPDALLWGSDWPCTNHESLANYATLHADLADWLGHSTDLLNAVRSVNPGRLYWGRDD